MAEKRRRPSKGLQRDTATTNRKTGWGLSHGKESRPYVLGRRDLCFRREADRGEREDRLNSNRERQGTLRKLAKQRYRSGAGGKRILAPLGGWDSPLREHAWSQAQRKVGRTVASLLNPKSWKHEQRRLHTRQTARNQPKESPASKRASTS